MTLIGADWLLMSVRVCAALVTFCATFPNARLVGDTVALAIPTPLSLMESLFEAFVFSITCSVVVRVPRPEGVNRTLIRHEPLPGTAPLHADVAVNSDACFPLVESVN